METNPESNTMASIQRVNGNAVGNGYHDTRVLPVSPSDLQFNHSVSNSFLHPWTLSLPPTLSAQNLSLAARHLQTIPTPVAFPTETVYGLAADATSSASVRSIFAAKQRPSDNPLIVHISSLDQLRHLLNPSYTPSPTHISTITSQNPPIFHPADSIPKIYHPLIERFWPGPLTILLPLPADSKLAPEVSANQPTFGARMPSSLLALALIHAADRPLAAPSANASTRPSPTTAQHVHHDLQGRIELILDGGPCSVGVESTVVDGLCEPPVVLRPGGVGLEELRACEGWEGCIQAWEDKAGEGKEGPRAPGMKYRHYSPRATVVLVEGAGEDGFEVGMGAVGGLEEGSRVGVIRARKWLAPDGVEVGAEEGKVNGHGRDRYGTVRTVKRHGQEVSDMFIGPTNSDVARGLFSALRELDQRGVAFILVEGIDDSEGETAAAVMNRLRKAATQIVRV